MKPLCGPGKHTEVYGRPKVLTHPELPPHLGVTELTRTKPLPGELEPEDSAISSKVLSLDASGLLKAMENESLNDS